MSEYSTLRKKLNLLKDKEKEVVLKRFFKTGKGEYGEGDKFLGITVPELRKLSKEFQSLSHVDLGKLLDSKYHEERSLGAYILVLNYQKAVKSDDLAEQEKIFKFYLKNIKAFNNWDLVDLSAPFITGHYFFHYSQKELNRLLKSKDLWERRIAILSGFYFIRNNSFEIPLNLIEKRLYDKEDLMHKACGWILRELGKRDKKPLIAFLEIHAAKMPRTALRYSLEKFTAKEKKYFMELKNKNENRKS